MEPREREAPEEAPDPLQRFTAGGWLKGLARFAFGGALVGAVLYWSGGEVLDRVLDPALLPAVVAGALVHALQRLARLRKWAAMIAGAGLLPRSFGYLVRIQFIGMAANQLLPVSEALKIWSVSANRRQAVVATDSIARDTALHAAMVGLAGIAGALFASERRAGWVLGTGLALTASSLVVLAVLARVRRSADHPIAVARRDVITWAVIETACQIAVYAIGVRAIGLAIPYGELLALVPLLFVADLLMITPSGLGLREAIFGLVFGRLSDDPAGAGVAVGLVISAMVVLASLGGGAIALLLPRAEGGTHS